MNIELIDATPTPEEAVCRAARNDYRADGVIDYGLGEIMADVDPDVEHLADLTETFHHHPAKYLDFDSSDMTVEEQWEAVDFDDVSGNIVTDARQRTLIDNLINNDHWGPFEHPQAVVAIEGVTRVVTHQLVRHRHFSYDQQSLRYVGLDGKIDTIEQRFQIPDFSEGYKNRKGFFEPDEETLGEIEHLYQKGYENAVSMYNALLDTGVPQEQARKVLPMGIKTNIVMSGNARAWMHILQVRTKSDVQGETRRASEAILDELEEWMPYTFGKYREMLEDGYFKHLAP